MLKFEEEKHTYTEDGVRIPSVTQILKAEGFYDFSKVPKAVLEASRNFGIAVHRAAELYDKGTLDISNLDINLVPPLEAWIKFKKDYEVKIDLSLIEVALHSKIWGFAGTSDRIPIVRGELSIVEIKSTTEASPAIALQTAGYDILAKEELKLKVKQRYAVFLLQDGSYKVAQYKDKTDRNIFLSAVSLYHWKLKKGIHNGHKSD